MKKLILSLMVILMTSFVMACPSPTPPPGGDPTPTPFPPSNATPTPNVGDPEPTPYVPTEVPVVATPTPTVGSISVAPWWPVRPVGVPVNYVFCPVPGPGGGGPEDNWRLLTSCPYDPYIRH